MTRIKGKLEQIKSLNEIQYADNTAITNLTINNNNNNKTWLQLKSKDNLYIIRYITKIDTKIITLDSNLPGDIEFIDVFEIETEVNMTHKKNKTLKVIEGSTSTTIKLNEKDKNADKLYDNYFILYANEVRRVKEYKDNILTLELSLSKAPVKDEEIILMQHFFNDYIIFGIDFTNFLGMDFSDLINRIGGSNNFQISSIMSVLCCLICCSICVVLVLLLLTSKKKPESQLPPIIIQNSKDIDPKEIKAELMSKVLPLVNPLYNKWQPKL